MCFDYILKPININEFIEAVDRVVKKRSHNSHLINLKYVKKFIRKEGGYIEMADGAMIPVSRNRKDLFLMHMAKFKG